MTGKTIENDKAKLKKLSDLLSDYIDYIRSREQQPLAASVINEVRNWVNNNIRELE